MISSQEIKNCKRILVIGCCGTGKSTFAKFLSGKLKRELIHLDQHFHNPNWVPKSSEEFDEIVRSLVLKDEWIMDGNYSRTLSMRASFADLIFFFDYPSFFCTYRILKRGIKSKLGIEKRTDLPDGCYDTWVNWEFIKFTWNFNRDLIPRTYEALEKFDKKKLLIFKNYREFKKYLKDSEEL